MKDKVLTLNNVNVHHLGSKFSITNFTKKETTWFYFENETEGTMLFYLFFAKKDLYQI